MKRAYLLIVILLAVLVSSGGCASTAFVGDKTSLSANGGPGAILTAIADIANGTLETSPGGFVSRNDDATLGVITNEDRAESKDVELYVRNRQHKWVPYSGPAEVRTPGWVKVYENGRWEKAKTPTWLKIRRLEAIHFSSPFMQTVTLRVRDFESGNLKEIKFNTFGREQYGGTYRRINALLIKLPHDRYRMRIYSYTGMGIFKSAAGYPYSRTINNMGYRPNPTRDRIGNTWVAWKARL